MTVETCEKKKIHHQATMEAERCATPVAENGFVKEHESWSEPYHFPRNRKVDESQSLEVLSRQSTSAIPYGPIKRASGTKRKCFRALRVQGVETTRAPRLFSAVKKGFRCT